MHGEGNNETALQFPLRLSDLQMRPSAKRNIHDGGLPNYHDPRRIFRRAVKLPLRRREIPDARDARISR
jgi:hypothetical protein